MLRGVAPLLEWPFWAHRGFESEIGLDPLAPNKHGL